MITLVILTPCQTGRHTDCPYVTRTASNQPLACTCKHHDTDRAVTAAIARYPGGLYAAR